MTYTSIELANERWRPVVGYEGLYSVSDLGRVRSEDRRIRGPAGSTRIRRGIFLKLTSNKDGYLHFSLSRDGQQRDGLVHQLVLYAFVGEKPTPKHEACHNDGDTQNNRLENLRWDTMTNNQRDRVQHGTHTRGERCGTSRFTEAQVRLIRSLGDDFSHKELARIFRCSHGAIFCVRTRRSWRWLDNPDFKSGETYYDS